MEKTPHNRFQRLFAFSQHLAAVHRFIKDSYLEKKHVFSTGLSVFKEELGDTLDKTAHCIDHVTLPVNNFLKDVQQIEKEFREEMAKSKEYCICIDGRMVPAGEVLKYSMEENY